MNSKEIIDIKDIIDTWDDMERSKGWRKNTTAADKLGWSKGYYSRIRRGLATNTESIKRTLRRFIEVDPDRPLLIPLDKREGFRTRYGLDKEWWEKNIDPHLIDNLPELPEYTLISYGKVMYNLKNKMQEIKTEMKGLSEQERDDAMQYWKYYFDLMSEIVEQVARDAFKETQNGETET
jgi:hypothetical protein